MACLARLLVQFLCCVLASVANAGAQPTVPARLAATEEQSADAQLLQVPEALRQQLQASVRPNPDPARSLQALADFLLKPEGLGLRYRHDATLSVAEAFERREGNCLTFTLVTVALARELGLQAYGQDADAVSWYQEGGSVYRTLHVNAGVRIDGRRFTIDIASNQVITREPPRPIDDARLLAHFHSNRAAELLALGAAGAALTHARQAIAIDPRHAAAHSNAGVIEGRLGNPNAAERAYLAALAIEPDHAGALFNLGELYAREQRGGLASDMRRRLAHAQQRDPFHHFLLGLQSEAAGDAAGAVDHLRRAIRLHRYDHRFHFALARAWAQLGRVDRAARALEAARSTSEGAEHTRYQAKLEGLRQRGHGTVSLQARRSG
ncbi:tetratricopeptide repeat protein [Aquimonas voraii]|uniref:Tetratricopeptide repeat-containing protein n=1 Tax=Aquimonas voraii TaxID=265719 RepID=A0A1G6W2E7_9GAMM|nr:tetratricopeptide repeat protein [Aquimonas voraii]SDD59964.1 Tetratricopeptide repeat-containing protein [Aquimonas voraii]